MTSAFRSGRLPMFVRRLLVVSLLAIAWHYLTDMKPTSKSIDEASVIVTKHYDTTSATSGMNAYATSLRRATQKYKTALDDSSSSEKRDASDHTLLPEERRVQSLLQERAQNGTVVLLVVNGQYHAMLQNALCNLEALGVDSHVIGVAGDVALYQQLLGLGYPVFFINSPDSHEEDCSYYTTCFKTMSRLKSKVVLEILNRGYHVLLTDADIVWFADVRPHLQSFPKHTIVIQGDSAGNGAGADVDSGFYWIQSSPPERAAWSHIVHYHDTTGQLSEQKIFNKILCNIRRDSSTCVFPYHHGSNTTNVSLKLLDRAIYANGARKELFEESFDLYQTDMQILHNNGIEGYQKKIGRWRDKGLWFVNWPALNNSDGKGARCNRAKVAAFLQALEARKQPEAPTETGPASSNVLATSSKEPQQAQQQPALASTVADPSVNSSGEQQTQKMTRASNETMSRSSSLQQQGSHNVVRPAAADSDLLPDEERLQSLLRERAQNGTVVLLVVNGQYHAMLQNALCNLEALGVDSHVIGIAGDVAFYQHLLRLGYPVFFINTPNKKGEKCDYHTSCFKTMTRIKSKVVLEILNRGYHVLFTDADIVWFADVRPYLLSFPKHTIVMQSDSPSNREAVYVVNSGFYWIQSSPAERAAMSQIVHYDDKTGKLSEQKIFNEILCAIKPDSNSCLYLYHHGGNTTNVTLKLLDRAAYPNGAPKNLWYDKNFDLYQTDIQILHNNWIVGGDKKIGRWKDKGLWFVNEKAVQSRVDNRGGQCDHTTVSAFLQALEARKQRESRSDAGADSRHVVATSSKETSQQAQQQPTTPSSDVQVPTTFADNESEFLPNSDHLNTLLRNRSDANKTVVLLVVNGQYSDMLQNAICNLDALHVDSYVIGVAGDPPFYNELARRGYPVFYINTPSGGNKDKRGDCSYYTTCFKIMSRLKSKVVLEILKRGFHVFLTDADIVWFADVRPFMRQQALAKPHTIVMQSDAPINRRAVSDVNSGFYLIHNHPAEMTAWSEIVHFNDTTGQLSEQKIFNRVLCGGEKPNDSTCIYRYRTATQTTTTPVTLSLLDRDLFPNGGRKELFDPRVDTRKLLPGMQVLHNNWIAGYDKKVRRWKDMGYWFINEAQHDGNVTLGCNQEAVNHFLKTISTG